MGTLLMKNRPPIERTKYYSLPRGAAIEDFGYAVNLSPRRCESAAAKLTPSFIGMIACSDEVGQRFRAKPAETMDHVVISPTARSLPEIRGPNRQQLEPFAGLAVRAGPILLMLFVALSCAFMGWAVVYLTAKIRPHRARSGSEREGPKRATVGRRRRAGKSSGG
jgi:hypothetical protein